MPPHTHVSLHRLHPIAAEAPVSVDFWHRATETAVVTIAHHQSMIHRTWVACFIVLAMPLSGCDRIKAALYPPQADPAWSADSVLLASRPTVIFRVDRTKQEPRAVPIATTGSNGIRALRLTPRGWRTFDTLYLHSKAGFVPYRNGNPSPPVYSTRGMWEGPTLDTIPCASPVPAATVALDPGTELLTSGSEPLPPPTVTPLSDSELNALLSSLNILVAPIGGIALSRVSHYRRSVHVVSTGATRAPTIVVTYDDPRAYPDSVVAGTGYPHHFVVVLDKGNYGYRPTYTYSDVSNGRAMPRRSFLGILDIDGDGRAELFFGLQLQQYPLVTYVYRFEGDAWIETFTYSRGRCG